MNIGNRINTIMKHKGLNYRSLGSIIGYSDVQVRKIVLGDSIPKFDFVEAVKSNFNEINSDWLLTGNGEMLSNTNSNISLKSLLDSNDTNSVIRYLLDNNDELMRYDSFKKYIQGSTKFLQLEEEKIKYDEEVKKLKEVILSQIQKH